MAQNTSLRGDKSHPGGVKISPGGAAAPTPNPYFPCLWKLVFLSRNVAVGICKYLEEGKMGKSVDREEEIVTLCCN